MRGLKYLFIVTVILFAAVFVITRFAKADNDDKGKNELNLKKIIAETDISKAVSVTNKVSLEDDDVNIDNKWAMFLVNNSNPLPDNYDNMIETTLVYSDYRDYYMDSRAADYAKRMFADAEKDGIKLVMVSAYRTIEYQQKNFDDSLNERINNGMTYEEAFADASASVAFPGKSEHNAGLAADIMCESNTSMEDDSFKDTTEYKWLIEHAHEYGFILRYTEGKSEYTGIIYEPWHFRFVGLYYAKQLKDLNMCLEEYYQYRGWCDESGKAICMTGPVEEADNPPAETVAPITEAAETSVVTTTSAAAVTEETAEQSVIIV